MSNMLSPLEPAAHLGPGVAGDECLETEFAVELIPEFLAAAVIHPGVVLLRDQTAGHGAEERDGEMLGGPVARRRMEHVRLPFPDRIETLERGHELTGGVQLDGQPPFGGRRDLVGKALCAGSEPGEVLRPRRDEVPFTLPPTDDGGLARVLGCTGAPGSAAGPDCRFRRKRPTRPWRQCWRHRKEMFCGPKQELFERFDGFCRLDAAPRN